ncbi:DUF6838 family protein [Lederbergia wuyishanensis]|uniref:Uncharacterized protein n=1 Tax=Lederbergia wuyishanensis TaxID=1347903 RepID=A0ABU0D741_9BACI|nr:hypothetical protein [Lederbergia wuyishanensis]MCJ8008903.1 hypothetical protein [Lederbergia wuyishanensis]MDQ0344228.1 hypothetical protein [Lederbergia wuyishanensis]
MVANLKSLIIDQIRTVFGNVKVYDEPVKQGLMTPAFQLLIFNSHGQRALGNQESRTISFNVNYYPESEDIRNECDGILETFQNEFKYIANKYHVHEIEGSVSDDVLVITFSVNALLTEKVEGTKMKELGGVTVGER